MNKRFLPIILMAILAVGCKPKDDATATATTSPSSATATDDKSATPPAADASTNSIVGSWTTDDKTMTGAVLDLKDGGGLDIKAPFTQPKGSTIEVNGTYKLDGDKLTFHMDGTKMLPPDGADDATKKMVDEANKKMANGPKVPDETDTVAWKDKDTFTGTDPKGKVTTYTRKS